jgi:hypothetical protein
MELMAHRDMEKIDRAWAAGLHRARFGYDSGICQMYGHRNGYVTLYICDDEVQLDHDFKSGTPYLLSMGAYRRIKADMDRRYGVGYFAPPPPPRPKKVFAPRPETPKESAPIQNQ